MAVTFCRVHNTPSYYDLERMKNEHPKDLTKRRVLLIKDNTLVVILDGISKVKLLKELQAAFKIIDEVQTIKNIELLFRDEQDDWKPEHSIIHMILLKIYEYLNDNPAAYKNQLMVTTPPMTISTDCKCFAKTIRFLNRKLHIEVLRMEELCPDSPACCSKKEDLFYQTTKLLRTVVKETITQTFFVEIYRGLYSIEHILSRLCFHDSKNVTYFFGNSEMAISSCPKILLKEVGIYHSFQQQLN